MTCRAAARDRRLPAVTAADLILPPAAEGSADVAVRVAAARKIQGARYAALGLPQIATNSAAPANVIEDVAKLDAGARSLIQDAAGRMHLTARGFHRVLKLARTLADLDGVESVGRIHIAEALAYRNAGQRQGGVQAA